MINVIPSKRIKNKISVFYKYFKNITGEKYFGRRCGNENIINTKTPVL